MSQMGHEHALEACLSYFRFGGCASGSNFTPRTPQEAACKQQCALEMGRCVKSVCSGIECSGSRPPRIR
jgi:hypothetical protein